MQLCFPIVQFSGLALITESEKYMYYIKKSCDPD